MSTRTSTRTTRIVEEQDLIFRHTAGQANRFGTYFDSYFTRVMGRGNYGGSAVGECYETASRIVDGDFGSWTDAWETTAGRVEALARDCLAKGHRVSARDAFMRAVTYWGATAMYADLDDPRHLGAYSRERICFREAAKLYDPPFETVDIPFEDGATMPGYFIPGGADATQRPTILVIGGGDSALEETFGVAPAGALQRGYNVLMFEIPGQRAMFHDHPDLFFRPDAEVPIGRAVDYALTRPEVDPDRIAITGSSFGGYFAPRAAAFDKRLAAVVAFPLIDNCATIFGQMFGLDPAQPFTGQKARAGGTLTKALRGDLKARSGYADASVPQWLDGMRAFTLDGLEDRITCPLLVVAGEGEFDAARMEAEKTRWDRFMNHPASRIRVGTTAEGAEGHSLVNNELLKDQIQFDWLDDVLDRRS